MHKMYKITEDFPTPSQLWCIFKSQTSEHNVSDTMEQWQYVF